MGAALLNATKQFPSAKIAHVLRPLIPDLLKILMYRSHQHLIGIAKSAELANRSGYGWRTTLVLLFYSIRTFNFPQDDTSLSVDFVLGIMD